MANRSKVTFLRVKLEEIDIIFDNDAWDRLSVVRVVGRDNGKASALWFPGELRDVVCESKSISRAQIILYNRTRLCAQ